jgi:Bacterial Ig-like domain
LPIPVRAIVATALALGLMLVVAVSAWAALSVSIDSGPEDPTSDRTPSFTFTPDAGATTVECSIDQETPASCTSPYTVAAPLADGTHTFQVPVADDDEEETAEDTFSVDGTPPSLSVDSSAGDPTRNRTPSLVFSVGGDATSVECWVDQDAPVSCTSPYTVGTPLPDGRHTFHVRASDALGNEATDEQDFTVDATPPSLSIGSGQAGPTNDKTPSFAFTVSGQRSVECWVDQGTPVSCTSPYAVGAPLSDGTHTFHVQASDALGNDASDALDFTIDTVRPAVSVTSGPTITRSGMPSYGFTAEAGARTECSIDRGAASYAVCASPYAPAAPLSDGRYTFRVQATDAAGNQNLATREVTVDSAAPSLSINVGPSDPTNDTTPSFAFTAEAGVTAQCSVDQGTPAYEACTSPYTPTAPLPEGRSTFRVRVTDAVGNEASDSRDITIDTTPPTLSIGFGPSGITSDSTPLFGFTAERGSSVACSIDQGAPAYGPCASATTHAVGAPLADGAYVFRVRATDAAGNQTIAVSAFTVDSVPDTPAPRTDPAPSPSAPQLLSPFPLVRISGTLTSTGARITLLSVRASPGALVRVTVNPACKRRSSRRCRVLKASGTVGRRSVIRFRGLARAYRSGTVIVVRVWRADRIGKYTRFTIMRGKAPRRVDQCLLPGATRGSRCPSA